MPLSEGEVEGRLESGHVGLSALVTTGFGGGPYAFHCSLAHTASRLIGLPHFCVIGLLDLLTAAVAPMVVARLPEVVIPSDKISTGLVECERVKAKIGKALRADGSPYAWTKFPPARRQKGFLS